MAVSTFDLFKVGIGPSSSHTVGPMRAAYLFVNQLQDEQLLSKIQRIKIELYGSLGATGKGHATDIGVLLGFMGYAPDSIDPNLIQPLIDSVLQNKQLTLFHSESVLEKASGASLTLDIAFDYEKDIEFIFKALPEHPNAMKFYVYDAADTLIKEAFYLSVGGGFVVTADANNHHVIAAHTQLKYPFKTGKELVDYCQQENLSIAEVMFANELTWRTEDEINKGLDHIWSVMQSCIKRGCGIDAPDLATELPGPLNVKRRAPKLYQQLISNVERSLSDPLSVLDWVNLYAMAVNEENAAGGRVVTAPTNGAAGIIPAVLHYYVRFISNANQAGIREFLLTSAAIGILYKYNASISGAEVGCQGEVGVACSMAAAGLAAVLGANVQQIENAAEIGMEHNLGLTCDPVGGLVQIPCIERNAMGATKAVNAARMALRGDGHHYVSLDSVIKTMRETGADMKTKYKETSLGGLAVNIIEC